MRKAAIYTVGRQLNNGEMYIFTTYEMDAAGLLVRAVAGVEWVGRRCRRCAGRCWTAAARRRGKGGRVASDSFASPPHHNLLRPLPLDPCVLLVDVGGAYDVALRAGARGGGPHPFRGRPGEAHGQL